MAEKTEQPTPKKIKDARKEGQVAKSVEIIQGMQLLIAALWLWLEGPKLLAALQDTFGQAIQYMALPFEQALMRTFLACAQVFMRFVGSLMAVLFLVTVITGLTQTGFLFAPKRLKPKLSAISIIKNAKNLFSLKKLYTLLRTIFKIVLLGFVFAYILARYGKSLVYLPECGVHCAIPIVAKLCGWLIGCVLAFYIIFAITDYLFERYQLMKQLRMSKDDLKREFKDTEGNPHVKGRIRQLHEEMQESDMAGRVERASAVIRNPTHLAVCIYYKQGETPLPIVTEKGEGLKALKVIELARIYKVPVVANVALARQLMGDTKIGDYIPETLFEPVAEVLRIAMLELDEDQNASI